MSAARARELIVLGGTSRAATTSVFRLLEAHPNVAAPRVKETRFFLPREVALPSAARYPDARDVYLAGFDEAAPGARLLDATPDYLHYPGCEERLHAYFPGARIVFVLRDPVDRMVSWFRYARQRGLVGGETDFAGFLGQQLDAAEHPFGPTHLLARAHGAYARRVRAFRERFERERVGVLFFEDLLADPARFRAELGAFLELDLTGLPLPRANASRGVRSARLASVERGLTRWSGARAPSRRLVRALRPIRRAAARVYWALNAAEAPAVEAPERLEELRERYAPSVAALAELLGEAPPWPRFAPASERGSVAGDGGPPGGSAASKAWQALASEDPGCSNPNA